MVKLNYAFNDVIEVRRVLNGEGHFCVRIKAMLVKIEKQNTFSIPFYFWLISMLRVKCQCKVIMMDLTA